MTWCADLNKVSLRNEIKEKIRLLDDEYISSSDLQIAKNVIALPEFLEAKRVFIYHSIGREVDTKRLMAFCDARGKPYALPRVFAGGVMDFVLLSPAMELSPKPPYGILEPPQDAPAVMPTREDIVIVPALCYDTGCYRLGHGGGYYDRFLADCPALTVGLCRERLIVPSLPRQAHDIAVDILVSEKEKRNLCGFRK